MKKEKKVKKNKKKKEFSKVLVGQESVLIWITTLSFIALAFICIIRQYFGELPWLTAMVGFPWTAYGVSQAFYYNKAKKENQIKLEKAFDPELAQPKSGNDESQEDTEGAVG